jgi:hypothetical protein
VVTGTSGCPAVGLAILLSLCKFIFKDTSPQHGHGATNVCFGPAKSNISGSLSLAILDAFPAASTAVTTSLVSWIDPHA